MQSMTGYGRGHSTLEALHVVVEMRAVNHRYLDIRTRFHGPLSEHTSAAEELVKGHLGRGRIELVGKCEGSTRGVPELDHDRARGAFQALLALRDELCPDQQVPLSLLSAVPDLFQVRDAASADATRRAVLNATQEALEQLSQMRRTEGNNLHRDLSNRVGKIRQYTRDMAQHVPRLVDTYRRQLQNRIGTLLPPGLTLDQGRLEHEIALFADRSDIAEELTRLESHCEQFAALLDQRSDAVGRRLDFMLQEMGRETNTIGSKVSDVAITGAVVELKAELERMREQAQNVL